VIPETLEKKLRHLPSSPGVYLFKDADGTILYIGKAKSLRSRVRSHFAQDPRISLKNRELIRRVADVDTIVVGSEAEALLEESQRHPQLKIMEAFMYRGHPQWVRTRQMVHEGAIGQLRAISSFFSYFNRDPNNVRNQPGIGGGGLMDIGCYPISLSRFLFDAEPLAVQGTVENDPDFSVDRLTSGIMEFEGGISIFGCSTQLVPYQRVQVLGTEGRIEIEIPFNAPPDRPCRIWYDRGSTTEEILLETADQYTIQGDRFAAAVLNDTPVPTPLEDAVANMRVIEAIFRSASSGKRELVGK